MQRSHALLVAVLASGLLAASPQPVASQEDPQKPKAGEQAPNRPEPPLGQPVNIKIDLTITDQSGTGEPIRKVVSMVVADRGMGSIRSLGSVRSQGRVQINVDARPQILQTGSVRLSLGLEYNPRTLGNDSPAEWSSLNEQIQTVVDPGKPLIVSQAADPASDRKITVEVRTTVMK
jgi:hypothetical protein